MNQLAAEYLNSLNMYIIVVGNPSLKQELSKIGTVHEYGTDLYAVEGADAKLKKTSMTPQELLDKYTKAIGGKDVIASVTSMMTALR